jgi:hypothetical protein
MPEWSTISALVMTVSHGPARAGDLGLAHAVADHLAATELHLLPIGGQVAFDLDDEVGIGQPHAVARGGAVHVGIGGAGNAGGHVTSPVVGIQCARIEAQSISNVHSNSAIALMAVSFRARHANR